MKNTIALAVLAVAWVCFALPAPQLLAQELNAEAKSKEAVEARAKRNAQTFENSASVLTLLDRYGKRTGQIGDRGMYDIAIFSPDGKRVATIKEDLENESADLWLYDVATGAPTRFTTSARTEFVDTPVWSPDGSRIAYVTIRKGQEGVYIRASNGQGPEELIYKNPGAFLGLSDWSRDGRFLTFAISDLKGGSLYMFQLDGGPDRKPVEIFHSDLRVSDPHFSADGRYLSYVVRDKAERQEVFVRPSDPSVKAGPWQISDGSFSPGFWVDGGTKLVYVARNQSVMVTEVSTSPSFSFTKPVALFRQQLAVPDTLMNVSIDGQRFLVLPPPRGQELQQITIFDQGGQVVRKVGEPGLYSLVAFSPEGDRLLVMKKDLDTGQEDFWVLATDSAKATRITNDVRFKVTPLWSPDGKYILYSALLDGDWPVYRKAADGTGNEEVLFRYTPGAFVGLSDISSDGKFLVCDSGGVILLVPLAAGDPDSRKPIEYLRDEFNDGTGRISPNGRFIAYRSDEAKPEQYEVYIRPFDAPKPVSDDKKWRVSKDGVFGNNMFFGFSAMLHWRGDGKEVLFRAQELDSNDLVMMAADVETAPSFRVATPRMLFRVPGPINGGIGGVSRDGQRFVLPINVPVTADKPAQPAGSE